MALDRRIRSPPIELSKQIRSRCGDCQFAEKLLTAEFAEKPPRTQRNARSKPTRPVLRTRLMFCALGASSAAPAVKAFHDFILSGTNVCLLEATMIKRWLPILFLSSVAL